jgi:hypothetical protein
MDGPDAVKLAFSVSHTTRKPREGEVDGIHYYFVNRDVFQSGIEGATVLLLLCYLHPHTLLKPYQQGTEQLQLFRKLCAFPSLPCLARTQRYPVHSLLACMSCS